MSDEILRDLRHLQSDLAGIVNEDEMPNFPSTRDDWWTLKLAVDEAIARREDVSRTKIRMMNGDTGALFHIEGPHEFVSDLWKKCEARVKKDLGS